jgi:hypothetical protein
LREDEAEEDDEAVTWWAVDRALDERRGETIVVEKMLAGDDEQVVEK